MRPHAEEFEKAGARLAVIGNGWPAMARSWAEHTGFPPGVAVLTDPTRKAYDLAGLKRSFAATLSPAAAVSFVRALRRGFRQGRILGDAWQQGGSLVVRPGGKVVFRHVSSGPGDHASASTLLAALNAAS
ncbi:MAG TPA: peroxiredoxin-like family protein [Myxococcales bacterium]|nr:peroxiredoxin-like family protein [Myxococcales bacterium]